MRTVDRKSAAGLLSKQTNKSEEAGFTVWRHSGTLHCKIECKVNKILCHFCTKCVTCLEECLLPRQFDDERKNGNAKQVTKPTFARPTDIERD
jgi:hypothetical protein